ncbi:MAG: class I adenylate cyclase, partial [bacterium]|nr:class I adenylate cyclase [bacterium]
MIFKGLFGKKKDDDEFDSEEGEASAPDNTLPNYDTLVAMSRQAKAFADYNQRKLSAISSKLGDLDRNIFQMLPALVHLNTPELPGFIKNPDDVCAGIMGFRVDQHLLKLLGQYFSGLTDNPRLLAQKQGDATIHSLSAMGSLATIAQTAKSDFDIWVCINKADFTEGQLSALDFKLKAIEEWADDNHFETHFFVTNIDDARENRFGSSDSESAGSALGKLLKEEFYRTHTVFAGKPPLWVAMPPFISDEEYENLREVGATNYQLFDMKKFIDLGNAQRITMKEAFGAALWQLNKALGSPFKSAMKMALIEDYMDSKSDLGLLCDQLKHTIFELAAQAADGEKKDSLGGGTHLDDHPQRHQLDGYLLMFNRILDYYKKQEREDLQNILRKCFYLKVGETIKGINDPQRAKSSKKDMLAELIGGGGGEDADILDLNSYKEWPFDKNLALGNQVNSFILDSYKRLSQSGAMKEVQINPTDLTVLGRKLFTFYSKKENKVVFLPKSFEDSLFQHELTFRYIRNPQKRTGLWQVYRGARSSNELEKESSKDRLLKQTFKLPELLLWLVINGVWTKNTHTSMASKESPITTAEFQDMLQSMISFFPQVDVGHLSNEVLLQEAQNEKIFVILNLEANKMEEHVQSIDILSHTSWGEFFYEQPEGEMNQVRALEACLKHLSAVTANLDETLKIYIPTGKTGVGNRQIYADFDHSIREAHEFFWGTPLPPQTMRTYVFHGERAIASFTWNGEKLLLGQYHNFDLFFQKREHGEMLNHELSVGSSPTKLLHQQALNSCFELNSIQVFAFDDGVNTHIYISDEMGGTYATVLPRKSWTYYGIRLFVFLSNIINQIVQETRSEGLAALRPELHFYDILTTGPNKDKFKIEETTQSFMKGSASKQVLAERVALFEKRNPGKKSDLVFRVNAESFSGAELGG